MASVWIVPAFDPFKDGVGQLFSGFSDSGIEKFELHRSPERLHHRIVVAITHRSHGTEQAYIS
jgi:hypothetical protein